MKEINPNYWAPHNRYGAPYYEWDAPIPITNPPILANGDTFIPIIKPPILANGDTVYYSFYGYNVGGPAKFYDRLAGNVNYFYEGD